MGVLLLCVKKEDHTSVPRFISPHIYSLLQCTTVKNERGVICTLPSLLLLIWLSTVEINQMETIKIEGNDGEHRINKVREKSRQKERTKRRASKLIERNGSRESVCGLHNALSQS
mmetsp:Transcript_35009/g.90701  ORF Transcript_35009/g.90701 Transcript_35009/m.90701 type:complete len:115 (-) Transcript_35009:1076-1420(-)